MKIKDDVDRAAEVLLSGIAPRRPRLGIVLGSGLGSFADSVEHAVAISFADIPGLAASTVEGHAGRFVAGTLAGATVLVAQGRLHAYEGHPLTRVVLPVRAMIAAGCETIVLTNAAGGIRADLEPGDLIAINDHLNLIGANPLSGPNDERLGPRFPDLSVAYDPALRTIAAAEASAAGWSLGEGVYCALSGPCFETPAEIRMLRTLGADLVGMSTVPEVIAARHMGARVLAISCVTNKAAGLGGLLSHDDVQRTGAQVASRLADLLQRIVRRLHPTNIDGGLLASPS